uniref:UspA domain-containing protein n=1 Tax=Urochloa decumbens TaxID=240449 RepID=A0ABC8XGR2_9POAL
MGRRLPALCGGGRAATRVRRKRAALASGAGGGGKIVNKSSSPGGGGGGGCYVNGNGALMVEVGGAAAGAGGRKKKDGGGRRVMVLADGRAEAAGALQWALSQAVRSNDTVVLLTVVKPVVAQDAISDSCVKMLGTKSQRQLDALKTLCESTRPEVKVETCAVEAEERAPAVVEAARRHGASLLVLGQRRRRAVARWLQALWRRRRGAGGGMVEYCIEHAPCVALAVRRRSSGGYLVSSKRHKDFWLLA